MENFETRLDFSDLHQAIHSIREKMATVVVGQQKMIDLIITAILADGHVLIEGVPGIAKTLTAKMIAKLVHAQFNRIQFTPDLMPSDVLGTSIFNLKNSEFEFKKGPIFSNLVLIDEINRAPAKTQAALFESMEERQVTMDGTTYILGKPFMVLATQNPIEHEGTYRLPEAQLDRFLFKIVIDYPTLDEETLILRNFHTRNNSTGLEDTTPILSSEQVLAYREMIKKVHVEEHLFQYIATIISATRNNPSLYLGASPRASLSILSSSKAWAALQGRDFVTPEDIKEVAVPVLLHRIILTPEKELEGALLTKVISQIIDKVEVPR